MPCATAPGGRQKHVGTHHGRRRNPTPLTLHHHKSSPPRYSSQKGTKSPPANLQQMELHLPQERRRKFEIDAAAILKIF